MGILFNRNNKKDKKDNPTITIKANKNKVWEDTFKDNYTSKNKAPAVILKDVLYAKESFKGRSTLITVLKYRKSFFASEGIQITTKNEEVRNFLKDFIERSYLSGSVLFELAEDLDVKGVLSGYISEDLKFTQSDNGNITRLLSNKRKRYEQFTTLDEAYNDCVSIDACFHELRILNYLSTRITPTFETDTAENVKKIEGALLDKGFEPGSILVTMAKFYYSQPNASTGDMLINELAVLTQRISGITGIPSHWLGWVTLMTNRATAQTLYESVKSATMYERLLLTEFITEVLEQAQVKGIEKSKLSRISDDLVVTIPLLSESQFSQMVSAYSVAYNDGLITREESRNKIPGLTPTTPTELLELDKTMSYDTTLATSENMNMNNNNNK